MTPIRCLTSLLGAIATAGVLATGCTTASSGDPRPDDTLSGDSTGVVPPRPRDIPLDDVDPCALIPEADEPDLYIDKPGEPDTNDDGMAECEWLGTEVGYLGITLDTTKGIEVWLDGTMQAQSELGEPIAGYATVQGHGVGDGVCFVHVDVADGQQLTLQVGIDLSKLNVAPERCEYAHQFAESAMSTLVNS